MAYAAGGAILGVTVGTVVAVIYLSVKRKRAQREMADECLDPTVFSTKETARTLLAIAIPITLGAAGLQIITTIDAAVYMARLKGAAMAFRTLQLTSLGFMKIGRICILMNQRVRQFLTVLCIRIFPNSLII